MKEIIVLSSIKKYHRYDKINFARAKNGALKNRRAGCGRNYTFLTAPEEVLSAAEI
ncbi:hypothetical protein [Paenibacillus borealis]|uniref:hypothetical protein n=1 Tax=Paenibacillus borealis TaxID=160799 RepID=UPI000AFA0C10|nr:hypothetical protein [Paenibacillus borealis]